MNKQTCHIFASFRKSHSPKWAFSLLSLRTHLVLFDDSGESLTTFSVDGARNALAIPAVVLES